MTKKRAVVESLVDPELVLRRQRKYNRATFDNWIECESHRLMVMDCLLPDGMAKRITLTGIGNGNDVNLERLSRHFSVMSLVDIDREAICRGLSRQKNLNLQARVEIVDCDLSKGAWMNVGKSDVTASLCMFSQLVDQMHVVDLGNRHHVDQLRRSHLRMLLNNTKPKGKVVFISDLVSSVTAPDLVTLERAALKDRIPELLASGNFFKGTNPQHVAQDLRDDQRVESLEVRDPWLWRFGKRCFAVYAIIARLS